MGQAGAQCLAAFPDCGAAHRNLFFFCRSLRSRTMSTRYRAERCGLLARLLCATLTLLPSQTVPPEHVPLVASLAHFVAAGQADLSSEELASRLENGLRGWDAGLGSHETRLTELSNKFDEHCAASDRRFVAAADLSRACAEQALSLSPLPQ